MEGVRPVDRMDSMKKDRAPGYLVSNSRPEARSRWDHLNRVPPTIEGRGNLTKPAPCRVKTGKTKNPAETPAILETWTPEQFSNLRTAETCPRQQPNHHSGT